MNNLVIIFLWECSATIPEYVEATTFNLRQRWRKVQDIISRVWKRRLKECAPALLTADQSGL